ncbi:MAG: hypothetical protein KAU91_03885, partial [Candidatus Aminicenantes bacterium]|nr:hypothetical protein [Candidatus Aminicenantes bacterium]
MPFPFRLRTVVIFLLLVFGIGITVLPINGQYFGRNKVQYEAFNFKVMKTEHFDIYFYPEIQKAA